MTPQPSVILFLTDQQRWDTTGLHGNPLGLTPNLDRLAQRGTHFAHSFTCQPVCGPARSCLQTGQYATTTGVWRNGLPLPTDRPTLATCFNDAGYHTGYIGKWHLSGVEHAPGHGGAVPRDKRGGYTDWLACEALEFSVNEYHTVLYDDDNRPVRLPGYRVDALTDAGIRFIDRRKGGPFFLMMSYIEPHHQNDVDDYPPPESYRERYTGRWTPPDLQALGGSTAQHLGGYFGMVKRLDEAIGRLQDALISLGLDRDTIVLFTSDHGCHFKTRNDEYKRSCHESSIRVPTAAWGGPFDAGGRVNELVSLVDLPPTLLAACGLAPPQTMQGRSALPLLRGDASDWPDDVFVQVSEAETGRAVRTQRWKYAVTVPGSGWSNTTAGSDEYTEAFLYDLKHDPHELENLVSFPTHAKVRAVMRERLIRRMTEAGEPTPTIHEAPPTNHNWQRETPDGAENE